MWGGGFQPLALSELSFRERELRPDHLAAKSTAEDPHRTLTPCGEGARNLDASAKPTKFCLSGGSLQTPEPQGHHRASKDLSPHWLFKIQPIILLLHFWS